MGGSPGIGIREDLNNLLSQIEPIEHPFIDATFNPLGSFVMEKHKEEVDKNWKPAQLKDILKGLEKAKDPKEKVKEVLSKKLPEQSPSPQFATSFVWATNPLTATNWQTSAREINVQFDIATNSMAAQQQADSQRQRNMEQAQQRVKESSREITPGMIWGV